MNKSILIFVLLSISLHLSVTGFLYIFIQPDIKLSAQSEQGSSVLNIQLSRDRKPTLPTHSKAAENILASTDKSHIPPNKQAVKAVSHQGKPQQKADDTSHLAQAEISLTQEPEHIVKKQTQTESLSAHAITNHDNINHAKISQILHREFSRHFYYPSAAKRRNWQGEVLLDFIVTADGNIIRVHISKSSGYAVLDNAAIDALNKIEKNSQFSLALNGHSIEQTLPVIYTFAAR